MEDNNSDLKMVVKSCLYPSVEKHTVQRLLTLGRNIYPRLLRIGNLVKSLRDAQTQKVCKPASPYYSVATYLYVMVESNWSDPAGLDFNPQNLHCKKLKTNQTINFYFRKVISATLYAIVHDFEMKTATNNGFAEKESLWNSQIKEFGFSEDFYRTHLTSQTADRLFSTALSTVGWQPFQDLGEHVWVLAYSLFIPWSQRDVYRPQRKTPLFDLSKADGALSIYWASFLTAHQQRPNPYNMVLFHSFDDSFGGITCCVEFYYSTHDHSSQSNDAIEDSADNRKAEHVKNIVK